MNRIFLLLLLIAASVTAFYSQNASRGKEIRGREIEWADFTDDVDLKSPWHAYTDWVTDYRFSAPDFDGGRVRVKISVRLFLTPRSWVRPNKKSDVLLEHERGHFNIGRICAKQIENSINSSYFSLSSYQKEIDDTYWMITGKCKEFEDRYDAETRHYNDREQQAAWNKTIADLLKK